jgi:hypothetical protein
MQDEEIREKTQELVRQIQEKSLQLSDLEVILEDYARERTELLREIGRLKASLWELIGDTAIRPSPPAPETSAVDESNE